jgi:hypothetical protein
MIPEYKLYQGAVLAELVDVMGAPVQIEELSEAGRLASYVLNGRVGLHVKHSAQRLHPWPFTFTKQNLADILALAARCRQAFIVLVCHTDGMVTITVQELMQVLQVVPSEQAWLRVDRRKRKLYVIAGGKGELATKKPKGVDPVVDALCAEFPVPKLSLA